MRRRRSTPYSSSEFYPGQVVYGPLGSLDNANWLHVTKEMKAARKHKMHDHKVTSDFQFQSKGSDRLLICQDIQVDLNI